MTLGIAADHGGYAFLNAKFTHAERHLRRLGKIELYIAAERK